MELKRRISEDLPELNTYFQSGGMVDAVLNLGLPAPIDVQVSGSNLERSHETALNLASEIQHVNGVADVYIPQDVDYPALKLDIDRTHVDDAAQPEQGRGGRCRDAGGTSDGTATTCTTVPPPPPVSIPPP